MSSFFWCIALEWGWAVLVAIIITPIAICAGFGTLTWFICSWWFRRRKVQRSVEVSHGEWRIKIPQTVILAIIVLFAFFAPIAGMVWLAFSKYEDYEKTLAVYTDLRTAPETLEEIAGYYRASTPVRIKIISDAAKKVSIKGEYEGLCISDFFEKICRQYDSQISCELPSPGNRTLTIDVKK
ncbi:MULTISPECIES: hypothetical protein [unclassified Bradyrhizobium]